MNSLLTGLWYFSSLIYNGQNLPRPNPDLVMTLEFAEPTSNILRYQRKNEAGFCERTALYSYDKNVLQQTVTWTNPENADFCSQDPDMNLGHTSTTPLEVTSDQMRMHLSLGEESIIYVWTRSLTDEL